MRSNLFFDRNGEPIEDTIDWAKRFEDSEYRIVAVDQDVDQGPMVSTIWQGLDLAHNHTDEIPPMIFETVLLEAQDDASGKPKIVRSYMCATEEEALHAHKMFCEDHLNREPEPDGGLKAEIIRREKQQ